MVKRLARRVQRRRAATLARERIASGLCFECGSAVEDGLLRLGSLRCHSCSDRRRTFTQADLTAAGLG